MELKLLSAGAGTRDWHEGAADRPLRTKGKRQAQKIGAWLGQNARRPDLILTDQSLRACTTAEKALKAAGWTARGLASSDQLAAGRLPDLARANRPLLVALPETVDLLLRQFGLEISLKAGVLLRAKLEENHVRILARVDSRELPDFFPYPAPNGAGRRPRPAYYYRQSAVIPFRHAAHGTEMLIVGSSSGRHWTVPKGIVEPGLSAAVSARIEAREEAGVEGRIGRQPLGSFCYEKWGAMCEVIVYSMEVTRVLQGPDWEERHRDRKWCPPAEAAGLLRHADFAELATRI